MTALYIHGFASSGRSGKVDQLREILGDEVLAPSLTHQPKADLEVLSALMWERSIATVVGSSMGGFYALVLAQWFDINVIVVNPSLHPYETARRYLGKVTVFDTNETFDWTERELDELREIGETVKQALVPETSGITWHHVLVLLAEKDQVLDARQTARELPRARIVFDPQQDHRFADLRPYADRIRAHAAQGFDVGEPDPCGD